MLTDLFFTFSSTANTPAVGCASEEPCNPSPNGLTQILEGNYIRLQVKITSLDTGVLLDPTTIALDIQAPDSSITTFSYPGNIIRDSAGNYHYDYLVSQAGIYAYIYEGEGAVFLTQRQFTIIPTVFTP